MNTILHTPLTDLDSSLTSLISSLQTSPTYTTAPAATQSLLSADDALTSALKLLETHQSNHARILRLRSEAVELEAKVRGIVQKAGHFRKEIEEVAPGILEEESEDEGSEIITSRGRSWQDVDYNVLLNFSRGIGKFNAEAAKEVQQQEQKLRVEAKRREAAGDSNGINGDRPDGTATETTKDPAATNQILERAAGWLNQTAEERKIMGSMAFPSGERLRTGILGQLQATREEHGGGEKGEEAVEMEIEKLIAIAEGREVAPSKEEENEDMSGTAGAEQARASGPAQGQVPRRGGEVKREEKKALDLDLWNESEEEDE